MTVSSASLGGPAVDAPDVQSWIRTQLWDQVPVSISVIDRSFHVVEANRSFTHTYGPWEGRPCYEVYKARGQRCEHCAAARTFGDGQVRVRSEEGVPCEDGPTWYLVHMVPLVRADGVIPYVIEMSTDITETKRLEQEKLVAERLAAVGQTVAGLAHGIKNVLMGLEGGIYVMKGGIQRADTARLLRGLDMLEDNISRISAFTREFLDFAKGRESTVELTDPNAIARQVCELYEHTAARVGVELHQDLESGIPEAPLDPEGLHTCLTNLVSNALDACETSDRPGRRVTVSSRDHDGVLTFSVADDGAGMDYEIKKKVFSKFFSTKCSDKGTGLGLLTTRRIVQQHGGKVSFESTESVGSVFRLELPRERLPKPPTDEGER